MQNRLNIPNNINFEFSQKNKHINMVVSGRYAIGKFKYTQKRPNKTTIVSNTLTFHKTQKLYYNQSFFTEIRIDITKFIKFIISAYSGFKRDLRVRGTGYKLEPVPAPVTNTVPAFVALDTSPTALTKKTTVTHDQVQG